MVRSWLPLEVVFICAVHGPVGGGVVCRFWALFVALALSTSAAAVGGEPASAFLEALRERGYHDTALLYLDRMDGSSLISQQFQDELAYQRGVTMVEAALSLKDRAAREQMLRGAKENLEEFLSRQSESARRPEARQQYVLLLREWAGMKVDAAQKAQDSAAEDSVLLKEAAALYEQAHEASREAIEELKTKLQMLKATEGADLAAERADIEYRDTLRGQYLLSLLQEAECLEEKAETEPDDSAARRSLLEKARQKYSEIYQNYFLKSAESYWAGLRARFYEARCLKKLGDDEKALEYLTKDVFAQPDDDPAARRLKTQALLLAVDIWMDESRKDYTAVIRQGEQWLETMRPAESEELEWIRLRLLLAQAHQRYADQLVETNPRDDSIKASRKAARRLARTVSRFPSSYQDEAHELLAEIPGGVPAARFDTEEAPETFEEARRRGTDAISEMQNAQYIVDTVPEKLGTKTDEKAKENLRRKLETAEEAQRLKRHEAKENLQLALRLAEPSTPIEDVNQVRRLLAYLCYVEGEHYDAAVLGEFVSRRHPGNPGARQAARIALAAYLKLYEVSPSETTEFETAHVLSMANYIVDTWSGTPEAAEAINTLIPFLIDQGRLDKAREYVENIPVDSPERGSAELRIGEALWRDYVEGMRELRGWEEVASEGGERAAELESKIETRRPELQALRKTALEILESGVARMKQSEGVDSTVPLAVLALAGIYIDTGDAGKAIALLDHPKIGVLPMVERNDPVVASNALRVHAHRVALRSMVSALPQLENTEKRAALLARIQEMIQALRKEIGDSPESQKQLAGIFYSLARDLKTQLQLLDEPADRRVLSEGFRTFLEQVRSQSDDLRVLNWVAESFASLGKGLATDTQSAEAVAECLLLAVSTYDQILENAEHHELTPELTRQLQFRKAVALRDAQEFARAAAIFKKLLREDGNKLQYQAEAARTYQLWAADPKEGIRYLTAIRGTKRDPETGKAAVWGWSRIAAITQRAKKFRHEFLEARYNTALCHYRLALRLREDSDRKEYLTKAKNDIVFTHRLYPSLGGREWFGKYSELLKRIQRSLDRPAVGLTRVSSSTVSGQK